jgi:hypothetical protein
MVFFFLLGQWPDDRTKILASQDMGQESRKYWKEALVARGANTNFTLLERFFSE